MGSQLCRLLATHASLCAGLIPAGCAVLLRMRFACARAGAAATGGGARAGGSAGGVRAGVSAVTVHSGIHVQVLEGQLYCHTMPSCVWVSPMMTLSGQV
jgi:hypothetical protein